MHIFQPPRLIVAASLLLAMVAVADPVSTPRDPAEPVMNRLFEHRLEIESARVLSINYFNLPIDHAAAAKPGHFTIISPDDERYAASKSIRPVASGSRSRAVRVSIRDNILIKGAHMFLELPEPLEVGSTYYVEVAADVAPDAETPKLQPVLFDDRHLVNDNIRVNQLGYRPDLPTLAYVGQYLGTLGKLEIAADEFELLSGSGEVVYTGDVKRREQGETYVGQAVYELDFTEFDKAGTYRVRVPGVGVSYPFRIANDALLAAYGNLMRGQYHQRCGHSVDAKFSRHAREACHLDDAMLDPAVEELKFINARNPPLYPTRFEEGRRIAATAGHHDAGDYGKYTTTGGDYVFAVLAAFEAFGSQISRDDAFVPYASNGIPDLIDEVKWELDWLENMQDPDDGAVFGVIKPTTGGYEQQMPSCEAGRFVYPKDTTFTASFAAALAQASRSPMIREHYPEAASRYLEKAKRAWAWLEENERFVQYFHYGAVHGDADERVWAAVELYLATGDTSFHEYVLKHLDPSQKHWDWKLLESSLGNAVTSYLLAPKDQTDAAMRERCHAALIEKLDSHVTDSREHPYRLSLPQPVITDGRYGWLFPGNEFGFHLLVGYHLTDNRDYLETAYHNHAYLLGANPFGYCLQTGLGQKRNSEVVDQESGYDDIVEPVPGLPLGIGTPDFYYLNQYGNTVGADTYPDDHTYPRFNRWYDGFNVKSEFTMGPMTRETVVAAYFAGMPSKQAAHANQPPTLKVEADAVSGKAPFTAELRAIASDSDGEVIAVAWDFGDETMGVGPTVTHTFDQAGREYDVTVTATDQHGAIAYKTIRISYPPADRTNHLKAPEGLERIWHASFDGTLDVDGKRASTISPISTKGKDERVVSPAFDDAPAWSTDRESSVLILDGSTAIRSDLGKDFGPMFDEASKVVIDARMRVDAFSGWGVSNPPATLGVTTSWDAWFGLKQEAWDRTNAPSLGTNRGEAMASAASTQAWPMKRWVAVRLTLVNRDGKSHVSLDVDGKQLGEAKGEALEDRRTHPSILEFGNFRGAIDEISVYATPD